MMNSAPLAVIMSRVNSHDSRMMLETVDAITPLSGKAWQVA
jgi:hypothetical protein